MTSLEFLYKTAFGRVLLKPLISRPVSKICGAYLDTKLSKCHIKSFAKNNDINTDDYILDGINSFNDFFCRRIKEGLRPVEMSEDSFVAPCDGLLTVYPIAAGSVIPVKQSVYTIEELLCDKGLAEEFNGGYCLVYRLCVDHYHRYAYVETGRKGNNRFIKGKLHTVRPIALSEYPVFVQNCREYCVIDTSSYGKLVQMEVGAMLVGRIVNDTAEASDVVRGTEKGHFEYGGSTIIVLAGRDKVKIREDITDSTQNGIETPVKMGEVVGKRI